MGEILKKYLHFLLKYKWRFLFYTSLIILWAILSSVAPYFFKLFIDALTAEDFNQVWRVFQLFAGLSLISIIISQLSYLVGDWLLMPVIEDSRILVFKKIQELDFAFHTEKTTGSLISAVRRSEGAIWSIFQNSREVVKIFVEFLVIIFFLSRLETYLFLLPIASVLIIAVIGPMLVKKNLQARRKFNKVSDKLSGIITDNLINFETVKYFAKEDWETKRLRNKFIDWRAKLWDYFLTFRYFGVTLGLVSFFGLALTIIWGISNVRQQIITAGDFIMVIGFVRSFFGQASSIIFRIREILKDKTDMEKYFQILDEEIKVKDPEKPIKIKNIQGEIKFDQVYFSYPEGKEDALYDFNLKVKPGSSVALVGESGAGKTTVVKLLLRAYDPDQGSVLVDKVNIKKYKKEDLRSHIGVVPQEPILFNNTIEYNIGYGMEKPSLEKVRQAAKIALLDKFILSLPNKYQSKVGERGIKLSGGQKQRIAIARMILSNPEMIIFDEATSQLDSESEKKIQKAFWRAAEGKTTIIIAHRLSTVTRADRIAVLEEGRIIETGTHLGLSADKNSRYFQFWQIQTSN